MTMKLLKYAVACFYLALFLFLALYDERLNPNLSRELAKPRPKVMEPENSWLAMLGIDAPAGILPIAAGEKQMRDLDKAIKYGKSPAEIISAPLNDKNKLSLKGKLPSFYGKENVGILAYSINHPAEVATLCRNNAELLHRYEQLLLYTRFTEPLEYGYFSPAPTFSSIKHAHELKLLAIATQAGHGDTIAALTELQRDMNYWRLVARSSSALLTKLISIRALSFDLKFAAEIAVSHQLSKQELMLIEEILKPFDKGENSFAEAFHGEALFSHYGLELSIWKISKHYNPEQLVLKHNATSNRLYDYNCEYARQAELPAQRYAEKLKQINSNKPDSFKIGVSALYNSVGEVLAQVAIPQLSAYIDKGHDLEGLRRLALLKVFAHVENVASEGMQVFFDAHAADLGNPYTGKPMTWDPKNKRFYFPKLSGSGSVELYL